MRAGRLTAAASNTVLALLVVAVFAVAACHDSKGGGASDAGPDAAPFECPDGLNPDGNGCFIPCDDGWHEGADGRCHLDCPEGFSEDENGMCDVGACVGAGSEEFWGVMDQNDEIIAQGQLCVPGCPEGMEALGTGYDLYCYLPCPDGWYWDDDTGRCHLECPEGMEEVVIGENATCDLIEVGERKECPVGLYDTTVTGPNPIYVNAAAGDPSPDGTIDHPFATIGEAIAAGGDEVTVYVAAGAYNEQVLLSGQSTVHLVGACADEVSVVGEGLGLIGDKPSGAIHAVDVDTLLIDGFSITSDLTGIRVVHSGEGQSLEIRNCRVEDSALVGIRDQGLYAQITVTDNTVLGASLWGIDLDMDPTSASTVPIGGQVAVTGNEVRNMEDCVPTDAAPEACDPEILFNNGIIVYCTENADLEGNLVTDFEHVGMGIGAEYALSATIANNVVRNVVGSEGLDVWLEQGDYDTEPSAEIRDNVVEDCLAGETTGMEMDVFIGIYMSPVSEGQNAAASARGNIVKRIQGLGVFATGVTSQIVENEFQALPFAIWLEGATSIEGNRVYDSKQNVLVVQTSTAVSITGNHFADCASPDQFVLTAGSSWDDLLQNPGSAVHFTTTSSATGAEFSSNQVENCSQGSGTVAAGEMHDITASGNFFYHGAAETEVTATIDFYVSDVEEANLDGNVFIGGLLGFGVHYGPHPSAMGFGGEAAADLQTVAITNNYVYGYADGYAIANALEIDEIGHYDIGGNTFLQAGGLLFEQTSLSHPAAAVTFQDNTCFATWLNMKRTGAIDVSDNHLYLAPVLFLELGESSQMGFSGNLVEVGQLLLVDDVPAVGSVSGNEFYRPGGYGVGVVSSEGISIEANRIYDTMEIECPVAGTIADAIHISGSSELGIADARIEENVIDGAARLGVLASRSTAVVEGNMYLQNGGECGGECDLTVQFAPSEDAVSGWDSQFASYPEETFGVLDPEYWCFQ